MGETAPRGTASNLMTAYGLALYTSGSTLGLAVGCAPDDLRVQTWPQGRQIASHLHTTLEAFLAPLKWTDLVYVAVACGPGSFTSTRLGVITARTLAQSLTLPLWSLSSLGCLAWAAGRSTPTPIAVTLPAGPNQVYGGVYVGTAFGPQALCPDRVFTAGEWQTALLTWPKSLTVAATLDEAPVTELWQWAALEWQQGKRPAWTEALPFYGRSPV
ncbi:MAG: tRNA (adenosine(37)-N6)-threonylcarbamoyltransferase complex dimerization subunit type 1 TsaB [Gloeomargaritaceae cyanobacterium C42_A2020_066]|nr:tRNA (adenosine(37)-N6)-threonylcarbamoyltransferase complex dimerization subunit type 1 TsaB [Gloeomargaritaceae cyanobacterium C42_A2020_066]